MGHFSQMEYACLTYHPFSFETHSIYFGYIFSSGNSSWSFFTSWSIDSLYSFARWNHRYNQGFSPCNIFPGISALWRERSSAISNLIEQTQFLLSCTSFANLAGKCRRIWHIAFAYIDFNDKYLSANGKDSFETSPVEPSCL
jgi:hypothetical protein